MDSQPRLLSVLSPHGCSQSHSLLKQTRILYSRPCGHNSQVLGVLSQSLPALQFWIRNRFQLDHCASHFRGDSSESQRHSNRSIPFSARTTALGRKHQRSHLSLNQTMPTTLGRTFTQFVPSSNFARGTLSQFAQRHRTTVFARRHRANAVYSLNLPGGIHTNSLLNLPGGIAQTVYLPSGIARTV